MITLPMLLGDLAPSILSVCGSGASDREYRGIYLIDGLTADEENMVYAGSCDEIVQLLIRGDLADGCLIFSAGDSEALRNAPKRRVTLVTVSLSLTALYNRLAKSFLQYETWQKLLQADARKGLRPLLSAAMRHFDFSLVLLSPDLQPLIRGVREEDEIRMALPPAGSDSASFGTETPGSTAGNALYTLLANLEKNRDHAALSTDRKNGYVYALAPIRHGNTVLGYLFACSSSSSGILRNILYVMASLCAEPLLNGQDGCPAGAGAFQILASQFLSNEAADFDKLEGCLKGLPNRPKRFMRGIIIRLIHDDGKPAPIYPQKLRQLYQEVQALFPLDHTAVLEECVYIMTSDEKPDSPITVTENASFEALLQKYGAYAMVSNPSQRLQGVRVLFRQCFQLLPAAVSVRYDDETERRCLRFDRYAPYYIIRLCERAAGKELGVNDILYLCHPAVLTLTRYDRAYNSNLRDTLFTFLMHDRNISETSRKLFMHRNTTIYKLNKIQELIHDNLENAYTRHQLILSCMIIRYVEQYQHSSFDLPPLDSSLLRK